MLGLLEAELKSDIRQAQEPGADWMQQPKQSEIVALRLQNYTSQEFDRKTLQSGDEKSLLSTLLKPLPC